MICLKNILMNYIGILLWGYGAAAYTTAICNAFIVIFHYFSTKKYENYKIIDNRHLFSRMLEGVAITLGCVFIYNHVVIRYISIGVLGVYFMTKCFKEYRRIKNDE